jgi:hypothetical protein
MVMRIKFKYYFPMGYYHTFKDFSIAISKTSIRKYVGLFLISQQALQSMLNFSLVILV